MEEDAHMTSEEEGLTDDEIQEALDGASSLDMSEAGQDSRKKRKKKRKKRKGSAAGDSHPPPAQPSVTEKQEADSRFATALEQLQRNSPNCTWTRLNECNIFDAKTKRIAEALRHNSEVTSLDLSCNHIGNAGAQALADSLQSGAAPELILLDLRENPFGSDAISDLEALQKLRRELKVEVGQVVSAADPTGDDAAAAPESESDPDGKEMIEMQSSTKGSKQKNGFLQRFFQVDNGGSAYGIAETRSEVEEDPETVSAQLWQESFDCSKSTHSEAEAQVSVLLEQMPPAVAGLSSCLRQCVLGIDKEMSTSATPLLSTTRLDDLLPFTRGAVDNLAKLLAVLDTPPADAHLAPHSKTTPVPGAGSHRAAVAHIVERLSYGRSAAINTHIVKAGLIQRLLPLCLEFPHNNILQTACCEIIRWSLESGLRLMWEPLFRPRMGAPPGKPPSDERNLIERVIEVLQTAQTAPSVAQRACTVGFALSVAAQMREAAGPSDVLERSLEESEGWHEFARRGGLLDELLAVQSGDLAGPRPSRPMALGGGASGDPPGGLQGEPPTMIDNEELLRLLSQSVHGMHVIEAGSDDDDDEDDDQEEKGESEETQKDALQEIIDSTLTS